MITLCTDNNLAVIYLIDRKICKNCLCPREEHDIREETESEMAIPVGKILFSPSADTLGRGEKPGYSPK